MGRWWNRDLRFPCPILEHEHELTSCNEFFQMTPKERQEKSRGRICKTCFKAGGDCIVKDSKCTTPVPVNLLCNGCVAFTRNKRFSPHNILFCNSQHPTHSKPSQGELKKVLEKYFGCPIGQITATEQVRSGTFTCTQTKKKKNSKRTTKNPRTTGTGDTIHLTQWVRVGGKPSLVMYDRGSNTNLVLGKWKLYRRGLKL